MVQYTYDAWGNHSITDTSGTNLGKLNPIRYRGYYWDESIGLYYLISRYYDAEVGRFVSMDNVVYLDADTVNGINLYAYCQNNPVMYSDPTGQFVFTTAMLIGLIIGAVVGAIIGGTLAGVTAYNNGARGWEVVGWSALGALGGSIIGGAIGMGIGYIAPAIGGFLGSSFTLGLPSLAMSGGSAAMSMVTVSGAQIVGTFAAAGVLGGLVFFSKRDRGIEDLKRSMTPNQREKFQREIEDLKSSEGRGGHDNLTRKILEELARLVKEWYK